MKPWIDFLKGCNLDQELIDSILKEFKLLFIYNIKIRDFEIYSQNWWTIFNNINFRCKI